MSHDELRLCGVALPGGGSVVLSDVSPGGIVPRASLTVHATHPPHFDPLGAGMIGEALLAWAIENGHMPEVSAQVARWSLPDPDVFAVLLERVLVGEEPTVENFDRYAAAYREACKVAAALPEALALLEQFQAGVVDAEVVEPLDFAMTEEAHADMLAEALRLTAEWANALAMPGWSWFDALSLHHARRGWDRVPETGRPAGVSTGSGSLADAIEADAGVRLPTDRPSVPLRPMPTVADLDLLVAFVERAELDAGSTSASVRRAADRLRSTVDAAKAARADFLDQLDGRDPVEPSPTAAVVDRGDLLDLLDMIEGHEGREDFATNAAPAARRLREQAGQ
jgi:hypothetical protein